MFSPVRQRLFDVQSSLFTGFSPSVGRYDPAMSAAPAILGTESFLGSIYPGFSLHETPAFRAPLAIFDKERAVLAGVVTLVSDLLCYLSIPDGVPGSLKQSFRHLASGSLDPRLVARLS